MSMKNDPPTQASGDELAAFKARFNFVAKKAWNVGCERESFLVDMQGTIVPRAAEALELLWKTERSDDYEVASRSSLTWTDTAREYFAKKRTDAVKERFGYELSACQLEDRVGPCDFSRLRDALADNDCVIDEHLLDLGLRRNFTEVAPETMPLDVYPDPTGRYQQIVTEMPREVLSAACRVIGTHIHIGLPDHETALRVYNHVIGHTAMLCTLGDHSNGERLRMYRVVKPQPIPPRYKSWEHFHECATRDGFAENPRNCWHLIRISKHGTIEFRMFGTTKDLNEIVGWAGICHALCKQAFELSF